MCDKLRRLMAEHDITQRQLGKMIGRSHSTIGHWLKGRNHPSVDTVKAVAKVFGVHPSVLDSRFDAMFNRRVDDMELCAREEGAVYHGDLPAELRRLERDWQYMSETDRQSVLDYIRYMQSKNQGDAEDAQSV